jgi:hypothetical protein
MMKTLNKADLDQFTGSENWYRHGLVPNVLFTDGARYVADTAGAYWLLDEIALSQRYNSRVATEEFQVWKLTVNLNHTGALACEDGNDNVVYTKTLDFTDFPIEGITLWFANNTIYLPSEH